MEPPGHTDRRRAGQAPARAPRLAAVVAAGLRVALLCFGAAGAALAQRQDAPPTHPTEPSPERNPQQPPQERARGLPREEGALPAPEERREELRTLNRIYRELMPPGPGTVPAPRLAPEPGPRDER